MARFLNQQEDDDTDGDDGLWSDLDDEIEDFLADADKDPSQLRRAEGENLWVGFDAEWVYDPERDQNRILSIQLYVPPQVGLSLDKDKERQIAALSRVIFASSPNRDGRPKLLTALRQLLDTALEQRLIEQEPKKIYVVGFALRFDLGALGDFAELKRQVDSVAGKVATVKSQAVLEYPKAMITGDGMEPIMIGLHFIDAAAHVPPGKALRDVGLLLDLPKLEIPEPYSIERMDEYLRMDPVGYRAYAMRDAEIAVMYALRVSAFAKDTLKVQSLPATASGLALRWYLNTLKEVGIDRLQAFGLQATTKEAFHKPTRRRRTYKEEEPTPMRRIQEAFLTDCYAGGRNEAMWIGPTPVGQWTDYDLSGAYSTGLLDLPPIDFDNPMATLKLEDFLGHVAGYALIDFEHRADTRFPVFAISRGGKGLIFPIKGRCYATAPELRAAYDLGCHITIRWGIVYPWLNLDGLVDGQGVPRTRLFGAFIMAGRTLRGSLKKQLEITNVARRAAGLPEMESLEEQAAKLYLNGLYGKVCQALRPKTVFDTRKVSSTQLKPSPITNPGIGAHVTGFIRAILAEVLNKIPRNRTVLSCTTDGFLSDATDAEIAQCLDGPLCQRFQQLCFDIDPKQKMLEVKHRVAQVVVIKTRGQLTGKLLSEKDVAKENDGKHRKIVLAKAGVQPIVKAAPSLDAESYKRLQNEKMLNLFLDRRPGKKILMSQFPSIRDQWENGVDLHRYSRRITLSMEPDLKRKLVDPRMVTVDSRQRSHLAMNSEPWRTVDEFDAARAKMDQWRRDRCLKTLEDWADLEKALLVHANRAKQRAKGATTMNLRAGKDECDLLRRAFLRAYAQEALTLTRTMTYDELAGWLTLLGYPTTEKEVTSARSQKLVMHVVPATDAVMLMWLQLQCQFPDADLTSLLAEGDD